MGVSAVVGEAWGLYQRFFGRLVATAAVVFVVLNLVSAIADAVSDDWVAVAVWGVITFVLTVVGTFWVQGAIVEAVRDVRDGVPGVPITQLYARTRPRLPALISAGVLAGLGVALGLALLVVPGLYLLTRWILVVPVIVLEGRRAGDSFARSAELVRGNGWKVFGVIVLTLVAAVLANAVIAALFAPLPEFLDRWLGGLVANSVVVPFVALAWTVMYYRLAAPVAA